MSGCRFGSGAMKHPQHQRLHPQQRFLLPRAVAFGGRLIARETVMIDLHTMIAAIMNVSTSSIGYVRTARNLLTSRF
jgi:hypothetical protein